MARRTKEEAQQTRCHIMSTALNLFCSQGLAKTSLTDIARAADLTRGAIYWHFTDKVSVFKAMLQRVKLPMERMFEQKIEQEADPLQALYQMCLASLLQLFEDERHYRVHAILLTRCEQVGELADLHQHNLDLHLRIKQRCEGLFRQARKLGLVAADLNEQRAALALKAYMMGLYLSILREPDELNTIDTARQLLDDYFQRLGCKVV